MRSSVFWDITPSSPLRVNRRFGRILCQNIELCIKEMSERKKKELPEDGKEKEMEENVKNKYRSGGRK
jgi:hypothetical protein